MFRIIKLVYLHFCNAYYLYLMDAENFMKQFEMLLKWILNQVNYLKTFVDENGLQRKTAIWKSASEVDLDLFPRLADEEVGNFTCGTYQLRLSSSYMQEHLDG